MKSYFVDRSKKFAIIDNGKIISKHISFYHAQTGVEKHLKTGKIGNGYIIKILQ